METKKLIFEDKDKFNIIVRDLKQYYPLLEKVKEEYEKLDIGTFDDEVFKKIKQRGSKPAKSLLNTTIHKQLRSLKITSDIMKKTFLEDADVKFKSFEDAVTEFENFRPHYYTSSVFGTIKPEFVSYYEGEFTVTDDSKVIILDTFCRIYLETKQEKEFYAAVENYIESYYKMINMTRCAF